MVNGRLIFSRIVVIAVGTVVLGRRFVDVCGVLRVAYVAEMAQATQHYPSRRPCQTEPVRHGAVDRATRGRNAVVRATGFRGPLRHVAEAVFGADGLRDGHH